MNRSSRPPHEDRASRRERFSFVTSLHTYDSWGALHAIHLCVPFHLRRVWKLPLDTSAPDWAGCGTCHGRNRWKTENLRPALVGAVVESSRCHRPTIRRVGWNRKRSGTVDRNNIQNRLSTAPTTTSVRVLFFLSFWRAGVKALRYR